MWIHEVARNFIYNHSFKKTFMSAGVLQDVGTTGREEFNAQCLPLETNKNGIILDSNVFFYNYGFQNLTILIFGKESETHSAVKTKNTSSYETHSENP